MKKYLLLILVTGISLALLACSDFGYYRQSVAGHLSIMAKRQPITALLSDPDRPDRLKEELRLVLAVREYADEALGLPVKESFSTYADIERPYVVWNVVAAPAYSLAAREWCFPVAGCVPYRGYYAEADALQFAASLREQGLDTHVYGVSAYSTLGWFDDPVLSSFVTYPDWALAGLLFHELAHQVVYADDDGDFNEAFATLVEQEGVRRWLQANRSEDEQGKYRRYRERDDQFQALVAVTRQRLLACYDEARYGFANAEKQACKDASFVQMRQGYEDLRQQWNGDTRYDRWFEQGLNNARFISAQTYRHNLPAFELLLRQQQGDLPGFYAAAKRLSKLPPVERRQAMSDLRKASSPAISDTSEASSATTENDSPKS